MRVPIHPRHLLTSFVLWNTAVNINCLLVVKYEGLYAYGLIRILHSIKGGSISGQTILLSCTQQETYKMGKSLVKLLRYHREIQYVVLKNIMMIATQQPVRIRL